MFFAFWTKIQLKAWEYLHFQWPLLGYINSRDFPWILYKKRGEKGREENKMGYILQEMKDF